MLGVSFNFARSGTIAFFATLFVALYLNEAKECSFSTDISETFDFTCNGHENAWNEKTVDKHTADPNEKFGLALKSNQHGCLKTVHLAPINSLSKVTFRLFRSADDDDIRSLILRLVPKEGSCPSDECEWSYNSPASQKDQWAVIEHKFPVKSPQDCYLELEVSKGKGELILDRFTLSGLPEDYDKCFKVNSRDMEASYETIGDGEIMANKRVNPVEASSNNTQSFAPGLAEISKNLMLTSASILALNNLLN